LFPDPTIEWKGLPSSIDGLQGPNLELVRGDSYAVRCVVSEWSDGECLRAGSIEFGDPQAFFVVEEMIYSIAYAGRQDGGGYDGTTYIKEADRSALKTAVEAAGFNEHTVRHFLLAGLSTCMEVIASNAPEVRAHANYDEAMTWTRREAA